MYLKQGTVLDYEDKASYAVTVTVSDGEGGSAAQADADADGCERPGDRADAAGTVDAGEVLAADTSAVADADGTPQGGFVFTRQWQRGVTVTDALSGQDTTTWTDITDADGATYTPVQADVGHTLQVVVSFTDAAGNDESLTSAATAAVTDINDAATGTVTIAGTVEQGEELTVSVSAVADADGTPQGGFVFTRQWQRGVTVTDAQSGQDTTTWTDITDADGATYTPVQADVGHTLQVVVSFTDAAGNDESLTSAATLAVTVNDAPTLAVAWVAPAANGAIAEHTATTARLKVAELTVADADPGDTHSFVLSGTDANVFEVVGAALYLKQGTVLDYEDKGYAVTVTVSDGEGGSAAQALTLTLTDANDLATG